MSGMGLLKYDMVTIAQSSVGNMTRYVNTYK